MSKQGSILQYKELSNQEQITSYQKAFLDGYGRDSDLKDEDVSFYKIWQSLRNCVYFASKVPPDINGAKETLLGIKTNLKEQGML